MKPLAASLIGLVVLVGCSSDGLKPDASFFKGLPRSVVVEALANPTVKNNLSGESQTTQQSLAQASVRNIIFCREELRIYRAWITTGTAPAISPGPVPDRPLEPGNSAILDDYSRFREAVTSGEPSALRLRLTADGSCGQWVPATAGDTNGPTIARTVQELQP